MAKFRVENMLQVLNGAQQGTFQARQQMQGERQAQQAQLLSVLPQLLAQADRRRQAALEPFDMAAGAPNQTPESMAQTQAAALAARQRAGALPDMGSIFAQVLGNQKGPVNVDLGAFQPQGGLGAAPAPQFRDLEKERLAAAALEDEAGLLRHDFQSRVNPSQGLPLLGALRRGENIHAGVPDPRSSEPTIDTPDGPSPYDRAIANNPTTAEAAAKERAALEAGKHKGRLELAGERAKTAAELAGLKVGSSQHLAYVRGYSTLYQKTLEETGNPAYAEQVATQGMTSALRSAPVVKTPGQEALAATLNPALPELPKFESRKMALTRQKGEEIKQGDRRLDMKAEEIDLRRSALTDTKQYRDAMLKEKEYDRALKKEIFQGRLSFDKAQAAIKNSLEGKKLALSTFEAHAKVSGKNGKPDPVRTQKAVLLRQRIGRIEEQINKLQTAGSVETAKGLIPHLDALNVEFDRLLAAPDTEAVGVETPTTKAPRTLSINGKSVKATYQALLNDLKKSNDPKYKSDPVKWANYYWNQGK